MLDKSLIDDITQNCLDLYKKLPKTGKPTECEWTVLSCIIQYDNRSRNHEVVSLGTGSKCIGATKMSPKGDILNDSHAEVIARRSFLLYLYDNIDKALSDQLSVFIKCDNKFILRENIEFVHYSSQLPCGDASIIPKKETEEDQFGDVLASIKRRASNDAQDRNKKLKYKGGDIHRTGAKCLLYSEQDPKDTGLNYHLLGCVRTKPGRGDRTVSVSCSDKIARWLHVGIQGALLSILCEPVFIKHLVFGAGVPFSEESLNRALLKRHSDVNLLEKVPLFYQCSVQFPNTKTETNIRPAPGSIVWRQGDMATEVAIQGRKLGITKKNLNAPVKSISISKYKLYERFQQILTKHEEQGKLIFGSSDIKLLQRMPYNIMKQKSRKYLEKWRETKEKFFRMWTLKPDIWDFTVDN